MKLYLDNCCFNRPFDDQSNFRIQLEAEAKLRIQRDIREGKHQLVWFYILDYENGKNPYRERREQIARWESRACEVVESMPQIPRLAGHLMELGIKQMDAMHLACAITACCDYFITTDKGILKRSVRSKPSSCSIRFAS